MIRSLQRCSALVRRLRQVQRTGARLGSRQLTAAYKIPWKRLKADSGWLRRAVDDSEGQGRRPT